MEETGPSQGGVERLKGICSGQSRVRAAKGLGGKGKGGESQGGRYVHGQRPGGLRLLPQARQPLAM